MDSFCGDTASSGRVRTVTDEFQNARLPLSEDAFKAVKHFLQHSDQLDRVANAAREENAATGVANFIAHVAKRSGAAPDSTSAVRQFLANLRGLSESTDTSVVELVHGFNDAINRNRETILTADEIAKWNETAPLVLHHLSLMSDESPLAISSKAQGLAYQHAQVVKATRIMTDIRPVFNADGTKILQMIVTSTVSNYRR